MIKFIVITVILILSYGTLGGLIKASGKKTPSMPDIEKKTYKEN